MSYELRASIKTIERLVFDRGLPSRAEAHSSRARNAALKRCSSTLVSSVHGWVSFVHVGFLRRSLEDQASRVKSVLRKSIDFKSQEDT